MKWQKIVYWVSTGLISAMMAFSAIIYVFQHSVAAEGYAALGYPVYIIYFVAVAKIAAVVVILSQKCKILKEWAYAGLCYILVLATISHIMVRDGEFAGSLVALVLLMISYYFDRKK